MIKHIVSKYNKLTQKECKTRHDWVEKVTHWELCKKFTNGKTNKWYMHKPESIQENERHEILWDFEILREHLISAWRPDLVIISKKKKENLLNSRICCSGGPQSENQRKRKEEQVLRPCQRTRKIMEHENDSDTSNNWGPQNSPQRLGKGTGRAGNWRMGQNHLKYSISKIG